MFTVVKVREGLARNDYKDPGWYKHPQGSVAYEWKGALPQARVAATEPATSSELHARRPAGGAKH